MQQRSEEWFAARLGKVTASRVSDVMATTKSGPSASRKNYMMELLCQRLTGQREESFQSTAMQRGTDLEPIARSAYEAASGLFVAETAIAMHPAIGGFAASPDGAVGADGLLEIKCPNTATHVDFLRSMKPKGEYVWQMMAQMECCGRAWVDFVSFDDRLPEPLQYACVRVHRDEAMISSMNTEIRKFLHELDQLENEMIARINATKEAA